MTPEQTLSLAKARQIAAVTVPGDTFRDGYVWQSGIHFPQASPYQAIVCYGITADEATARRDAVLAALAFASESLTGDIGKGYGEKLSLAKAKADDNAAKRLDKEIIDLQVVVTACLQDPMYADHAEISKTSLRRLLTVLAGEFA